MTNGNFHFLSTKWDILANLGETAERNVFIDPNTTLMKLRVFAETLTKFVLAFEEIKETYDTKQTDRIQALRREDLITQELEDILETIRKKGNKAMHEGYGTQQEAHTLVHMAFRLAVWFMQVYGAWDFTEPEYQEPAPESKIDKDSLQKLSAAYDEKVDKLENELQKLRQAQLYVPVKDKQQRKKDAKKYGSHLNLTEAETRIKIDEQLRDAGWEADTEKLRYGKGVRPQKGKNLAIAEWPLKKGFADYALFIGLDFVGIVEAKRVSKNIPSDIEQAKNYARLVERKGEEAILQPYGDYFVPFLFATNGQPFVKQFAEKSGIWFLDARKSTNHPRPLKAWYSPQGLKELLKQDVDRANQQLHDENLDYLNLRSYQEDAIKSVERAVSNEQRHILLAMATGTGKTRMAIGLIYRLIKHNRFKRILFLVDRTSLGEQAEAAFKDSKLENYHSFTEIFELQSLENIRPNPETKVQIATVQGMLNRLFYSENDQNKPTVDQYDCIIVDEAHRGYTLDKEMSEVEELFRDHQDYVSKYRQVLDYFDATKIGLTATPALHTVEIFGKPVYTYSYREAVIDGYLIDHEPPYQFETALKKTGIKWSAGDTVDVYNTRTGEIETELLEDEVNIEVTNFNRTVITENFNRVILTELAKYIDPTSLGKTLIFAATDDHADMVVRIFKEELEEIHGPIDDNAVMKITGSIKNPSQAIKLYKNERLPNIAVTVDLLTTGIDVPAITNLVFLRRVRSRILYEQMLGRATRRYDEIGKDHFSIYDAVGLYESLKPYTTMKPVVTSPKVTVMQLVDELEQIEDKSQQEQHKEELIAKVQRRKQRWMEKDYEDFKVLSGGKTVNEFVAWMKQAEPKEVVDKLTMNQNILQFLDENRGRPVLQYISTHEDEIKEVTRGYGDAEKPEDYLQSFNQFIKENMNLIPALQVVCSRPKELTRNQLRELRIALDQKGFTEKGLQTAWRDAKNEDIAADIISFIRQQALGDPLIDHEERIKQAMKKIYAIKAWPKVQRSWLERIEKQLLKESVLDPDPEQAFNVEPFKSRGGYKQLNKIFSGQLDDIVSKINYALYVYDEKEQA
ncbi:type I restriction enzyme, R subunit [Fictibacillus enclensis]|uniref:Type I restriction endonuclease subunit R n=1 Tax=Fictibacillus enclensis TaxID=1017270 RepID=A0A0V8IUN8_9BACL|nr:type I restriction-modification system endonuclease [Fictibacillus enclensis]KSU78478.1 type I restriction endonuclease subunit R [Fictibacillus enclensis]SCC40951.1 type I restriction enzyme, R subunit [Fictibacillus enclensis]